ncbi:MAG TPA: prepilin-type N-terminal cleavage/methylation domain-containing protein [Planctomycetota bacterium]|nr:prepilin-type N-terminal cleavage/methylation domain-containing protein [Planctomycetota bacterium]
MKQHSRTTRRSGFSALEMMVAVTLLSILAGSLTMAIKHMRNLTSSSSVQSTLQLSAERAMKRIAADLSRSGTIAMPGGNVPFRFDDGNPITFFQNHAHAPAQHHAVAGDSDFGPSTELVFAQPQENDLPGSYGNDVPDIDANADLIWDAVEFSYVLITGPDGINYLQRRTDAANPVTIASNVERVVFDDQISSGNVLPVESLRVRLFFRKLDAQGVLHRHSVEQIIKLRNGV